MTDLGLKWWWSCFDNYVVFSGMFQFVCLTCFLTRRMRPRVRACVLCGRNGSAMSVIRRRWEDTANASMDLTYRAYDIHTRQIIWERGVPSQEQTDGSRYTRSSAFYFLLMERLDWFNKNKVSRAHFSSSSNIGSSRWLQGVTTASCTASRLVVWLRVVCAVKV